ncbi:MAG: PAS domain S-box protein [Alkalispirochaeta sp.]
MPRNIAKRLLLVEDEAIIAMHQKVTLEKNGYQVTAVHSGEKAVEAIKLDSEIDLILMDIDLGRGISGDQAAEQILEIRHVPIVFLTSHNEQEYVERVKKITRYGYVIKNSGEFVLWDTIEVAFELFEANSRYERANTELTTANEQLERFFSVNLDLLCIADTEGNFIKVNSAWEEILGYPVDELKASKLLDFVHPDDIDATVDAMERLNKQGEVINFVNRYRSKDGSYRYVEWRSHPSGNLIYAAARDITERMEYERALRDSETAYRNLFEQAPIGIFRTNSHGKPLAANTAMARILGLDSPQHALDHYTDLASQLYLRPERREEFMTGLEEHGYVQDFEYEAVRPDGRHIWLSMSARTSGTPTTEGLEIEGFAIDVTEQKKARKAIEESENRFRSVVENAPDAIFVQTNGTFTYLNLAALELFGASTPEQLIGTPVANHFHEKDRERVRRRIRVLNEDRTLVPRVRETCLKLDGTAVLAEVSATPFNYKSEQGALVFARNVEQEAKLEQKEQEISEEYKTVFNGTQDAMFLIDVEEDTFTYKRNNRSHEELTGLSLYDIQGKTPRELLGDEIGAIVQGHYETCVRAKEPISYEEALDLPAGERIWETTLTPIMQDGEVHQIVGSARDITDRKRDQEQIDALLVEKDLLLKEVHHRIKNNMHTMMSLLSLEGRSTEDPALSQSLTDARGRLQSMEVLYDRLYQSGQYAEMPLSEYLPALIDDMVGMSPKAPRLTVNKTVEPIRLHVRTLFSIGLIVTELITNALKHGFRGRDTGTIRVSAIHSNGRVTLTVEDDGPGPAQGVRAGGAEGFGIALITALAEQLGGSFRIESDKGTRGIVEFAVPPGSDAE